jgi:hypothetical protein
MLCARTSSLAIEIYCAPLAAVRSLAHTIIIIITSSLLTNQEKCREQERTSLRLSAPSGIQICVSQYNYNVHTTQSTVL